MYVGVYSLHVSKHLRLRICNRRWTAKHFIHFRHTLNDTHINLPFRKALESLVSNFCNLKQKYLPMRLRFTS